MGSGFHGIVVSPQKEIEKNSLDVPWIEFGKNLDQEDPINQSDINQFIMAVQVQDGIEQFRAVSRDPDSCALQEEEHNSALLGKHQRRSSVHTPHIATRMLSSPVSMNIPLP